MIEVTNDVDDMTNHFVQAITLENTGYPDKVGKPLARPICVNTLVKRWVREPDPSESSI
ncbi:hypothetical protein ACPPVW_18110 [Leifsonia sp. McL0607]|uniref:hypothetical protein n=1 Tax=Leifsonia sp. McL0607 TaxID=3415672 RepID=UPI003CF82B0F